MPPRNAVLVISEAIGLVEASPASREHKLRIAVFTNITEILLKVALSTTKQTSK
jgi:hypothetical protein